MLLIITAVSALVPSLLLIWYFWARDRQREPGKVLWATFGFGVLTVIPVLIVALPVARVVKLVRDPYLLGALEAFFTAAAPEEAFKLTVLLLYCERHKHFDEPMDGIVYGAVASLGFATLENVLYVSGGGLGVAVLRALTAVPGHAFLGAILGYYVGQAKFNPTRRRSLILKGYLLAVLLHGLYDFPLLALKNFKELEVGEPPAVAVALVLMTLAALVFEGVWTVSRIRRLRADQDHVVRVHAAMGGAPPPPPPSLPAGAPSRTVSWIMLVSGGLLASVGGLFTLVMAIAMIAPPADAPKRTGALLVATAVVGVLPLGLGVLLFALGIRRLGAATPLPQPGAQAQMRRVA